MIDAAVHAPPVPDDAERHHASGLEAMRAGDRPAAIAHFRAAIGLAPRAAAYHANLGSALQGEGCLEAAVAAFDRASALAPDNPAIHHNRGNALLALRHPADAAGAQARAVALAPRDARFRYALGLALDRADRREAAEESYRAALTSDPGHAHARSALALLRLAAGDRAGAMALWREQALRERGPGTVPAPAARLANRGKLRHDVEQLRWLGLHGGRSDLAALAPRYDALLARMPNGEGEGARRPVALPDEALALLGGTYGREIHRIDAPDAADGALAARDWGSVEAAYAADAPGIVAVDGLLTADALSGLRRFCLGSTIFHHIKHGGYVGAYLPEVATPLLVQIAEELPRRMPSVFRQHRLRQMWIYKYDSHMDGIGLHADAAAVNVNFWLTPDEANLDPGSGGLVVHRCEAPLDWSFRRFNEDEAAIADYVARHGAGSLTIPYRCNRAIIFHSDLFHATDRFRFRDRYEDRRLNVTLLYGDRADAA
ncbi:MAG: tetratricopeptide repeat protein [Alphaproteobacteria bacterium]